MGVPVKEQSFKFALKIVRFYTEHISCNYKYRPLFYQLLKSGTSIGANIEEASAAQSRRDFLAKMYISFKEANETRYWLKLILEAKIVQKEQAKHLLIDIESIIKLLASITKTTKKTLEV